MSSEPRDFFNAASEFYDEMINFPTALENRKKLLAPFLPDRPATVADFGAGSGVDSLSAAVLGHQVTAFDISAGMLAQLQDNARKNQVSITTVCSDISAIEKFPHSPYDYAFCLGNTLALLPADSVTRLFTSVQANLKPGGKFLVQIINYEALLLAAERIVAITTKNGNHFIRFYSFLPQHIEFHILRYQCENPADRELLTTVLYPHTADNLIQRAENCGLQSAGVWGGLSRSPFEPQKSKDLVLEFSSSTE